MQIVVQHLCLFLSPTFPAMTFNQASNSVIFLSILSTVDSILIIRRFKSSCSRFTSSKRRSTSSNRRFISSFTCSNWHLLSSLACSNWRLFSSRCDFNSLSNWANSSRRGNWCVRKHTFYCCSNFRILTQ